MAKQIDDEFCRFDIARECDRQTVERTEFLYAALACNEAGCTGSDTDLRACINR